jgi:dTDP-4-dehydrorhamnose 3,5-epimerase|tara:strand:+ start:623 stop:1147 length:525 start_codon:yes stop_codon:yes gene_type:complete
MKIKRTKFKDLVVLKKDSFKDNRGYFRELFLQKIVKKKFIFDTMSFCKKNVLRGLHLQLKNPQGKYITVLQGKIFDIALDLRKNSKTFGKHFSIILSGKENTSIYIPEGFAHGYCTLEKNTIIHYKCTNYRDKNSERGIFWNDPKLKIKWPIKKPILSIRDRKNLNFKKFIKNW